MKTLVTAIAATFFAAGVSAESIYRGFADGNPDLSGDRFNAAEVTAMQPSVGDSFDRYHGWSDGNPDLFSDRSTASISDYRRHQAADIYGTFDDGNSDL